MQPDQVIGDRPFCDARTWGKVIGDQYRAARLEWHAWSVETYGWPFLRDTFADTGQAPFAAGDPACT